MNTQRIHNHKFAIHSNTMHTTYSQYTINCARYFQFTINTLRTVKSQKVNANLNPNIHKIQERKSQIKRIRSYTNIYMYLIHNVHSQYQLYFTGIHKSKLLNISHNHISNRMVTIKSITDRCTTCAAKVSL